MNSPVNAYSPLVAGRKRFELHKNQPSNIVRHSSVEISRNYSLEDTPNRMAGVATSYDSGDFDTIFATKDKPLYKSTNASYGMAMPQFHAYENTYNDVQRLRENLMQRTQLSRKGSESEISIAENLYAPEFAIGTKDPHAAPKFNPALREQAHARRIEDLKRLRTEEMNSQLRSMQRQAEYKEYLDMQLKLKEGDSASDYSGPSYSIQPRHTRKSPKTTSYNPLIGEVKDYSEYLFKEDVKLKYGTFTPPPVPGSFNPSIVKPQLTPDMSGALNAFFAVDDPKPEARAEPLARKKLAGYGQLVMNGPPPETLYTRKSGLGYRPTAYLIR